MKKLLILVFLFVTFNLFSSGLEPKAAMIREKSPDVYSAIKTRAEREWPEDPSMVLYTINSQCESFVAFIVALETATEQDKRHFALSLYKWTDGGENSIDSAESPFSASTDWVMVMYEVKKQIEASRQY